MLNNLYWCAMDVEFKGWGRGVCNDLYLLDFNLQATSLVDCAYKIQCMLHYSRAAG